MSKAIKLKCHTCFGRGYIAIPDFEEEKTPIETMYGSHVIPSNWAKIDHVYIWFRAFITKNGRWNGIPGYVYETPSGDYYAPFRGELIKVTKDTRNEFREQADAAN